MSSESIVIDLHKSRNTAAFKDENRIYQYHFDQIKKLIDDVIKTHNDKEYSKREYNTFSVLGTRGSGKTSFILSINEYYKGDDQVLVMDMIDPTMIEEKGHIFLNVIAAIHNKIEGEFRKKECIHSDMLACKKKKWENQLSKLSKGLPYLDGIGTEGCSSHWEDADFIMRSGIKNVSAAQSLENNFAELIRQALEILNKKVILFSFDDIDIDFIKGWPVLEMIRKYFRTPQIITILSGDLKLYSKGVRKRQWKNFGKALLVNEGDKLNSLRMYNDLVTEMESQYLQKLLPSSNRINLPSILNLIDQYQRKISIKENETATSIKEYYLQKVNNVLGVLNQGQAKFYTDFLLSLPLRTQIQFLLSMENDNKSAVTNTFISDLLEKRIDYDLLVNTQSSLVPTILKLLIEEKELAESYQLQPITLDSNLNGCFIVLTACFNEVVKKRPALIFEYLVKVGLLRNLLSTIEYGEKASLNTPSIEGLCIHSGVYLQKGLRDIVGNINGYVISALSLKEPKIKKGNFAFVIPVYGLKEVAKTGPDKIQRIDEVLKKKEISNFDKLLSLLPFQIFQCLHKNQSQYNYSLFALLGVIGDWLNSNAGISFFIQMAQVRTYPLLLFNNNIGSENEISCEENGWANLEEDETIQEFLKKMQKWRTQNIEIMPLSPHLMGKISTRLCYAIENIITKNKPKELGELMHLQICAFLNAILIEEGRERLSEEESGKLNINFNNIATNDNIFKQNLQKLKSDSDCLGKLPLLKFALTCPLLLSYLNDDTKKIINTLFTPIDVIIGTESSVLSTLNQISILKKSSQIAGTKKMLQNEI